MRERKRELNNEWFKYHDLPVFPKREDPPVVVLPVPNSPPPVVDVVVVAPKRPVPGVVAGLLNVNTLPELLAAVPPNSPPVLAAGLAPKREVPAAGAAGVLPKRPVEGAGVLPNRDGVVPVEGAGVLPKRLLLPNKDPLLELEEAAVFPNSVILHGEGGISR